MAMSKGESEMEQTPKADPPVAEDEHDRMLLADVEQFGWHLVGIEQDNEEPAFVYSVGLYQTFKHSEILVVGLSVDVMFGMVNWLGEAVRRGKRFEDLDESGDVLDGHDVAFRSVEQRHYKEYVGCALWFYRGSDFPLLQCVWPDNCHRYPWHTDFPAALKWRQPLVGQHGNWPFHEGKNRACFTTHRVLQGSPILLVSHDEDGDWQFLCGTTNELSEAALVCLGDMLARDDTLNQVADLPEGWMAERSTVGAPWARSRNEEVDDGRA
jgi:hypothetical protein